MDQRMGLEVGWGRVQVWGRSCGGRMVVGWGGQGMGERELFFPLVLS